MLPDTYEITMADLRQAQQRQQLTLQPGDAVIRTVRRWFRRRRRGGGLLMRG